MFARFVFELKPTHRLYVKKKHKILMHIVRTQLCMNNNNIKIAVKRIRHKDLLDIKILRGIKL